MELDIASLKDFSHYLLLFGFLMILIGVVGGGIEIQKATIPRVTGWIRALSGGIGVIFVLIAIASRMTGSDAPPSNDQTKEESIASEPVTVTDLKEAFSTGYTYYHVCNVRADDPDGGLNVRDQPGVTFKGGYHEVAGTMPHDATRVKYLGERALVGRSYWYNVRWQSISGFANSAYLCPGAKPAPVDE